MFKVKLLFSEIYMKLRTFFFNLVCAVADSDQEILITHGVSQNTGS